MKIAGAIGFGLAVLTSAGFGADDPLDRVDDALTGSYLHDEVRVRLSGALDLEGYHFSLPAPGLILTDNAISSTRGFPSSSTRRSARTFTPSWWRAPTTASIPATTAPSSGSTNTRSASRWAGRGAPGCKSGNSPR
jgi:hypothetical protein